MGQKWQSVTPPLSATFGKVVTDVRRIGKRIVLGLEDDLFLVIHLMIAGRFRWDDSPGAKVPGRVGLMAMDFDTGTLILTEASKKKRASLHLVRGEDALAEHEADMTTLWRFEHESLQLRGTMEERTKWLIDHIKAIEETP